MMMLSKDFITNVGLKFSLSTPMMLSKDLITIVGLKFSKSGDTDRKLAYTLEKDQDYIYRESQILEDAAGGRNGNFPLNQAEVTMSSCAVHALLGWR